MNAILLRELGGPEKLRLEDTPDPTPCQGEAVVSLRAAALNHRDAWIRHGLYAGIKLPIIPGSDGAGEVGQGAIGVGLEGQGARRELVRAVRQGVVAQREIGEDVTITFARGRAGARVVRKDATGGGEPQR